MLEEAKKRMASVNFTLVLLLGFFAVYRGVDPCESLFKGLLGVEVDVVETAPEGPPLRSEMVIHLEDGRVIKVLENGAITVEEP